MRVKKLLCSILALTMVLSTMGFTVLAEDTDIIEVGTGKTYETWSAAIAAATDTDADGAITYHVYGKVIMDSFAVKGEAATINIIGMTDDAELSVETAASTDNGVVYVNNNTIETVNFSNLKLSRPNGEWRGNEGHHNRFFTVWDSDGSTDLITYTNCIFPNGAGNNQYGKTTYTDCTFNNDVYYALWIYGSGDKGVVEVTRCTFDAARGVKIYSEDASATVSTTITESSFDIADKPAIVSSIAGELVIEDVDATACEYGLLASEPKDGRADLASAAVTVDGEEPVFVAKVGNMVCTDMDYAEAEKSDTKPIEIPVASIGTKYYTSLQSAIDAAEDGATITIIANTELTAQNANPAMKVVYNRESYAGLIIPDDKVLTIDLNGKTVSYVDEYGDCDNLMILNLGNLTVNDSVGGGKITYKPVAGTTQYSYFYSTIFNCGTLTVNGGTIENTAEAETDVTNAVDNHSRLSHEYGNDCILTVNGGHLTGAYYYAIRQYTHYFEGVQNRVTINDGTIEGGIYMQHGDSWYYADASANRLNVDGYLTINGGNFIATSTDNFNTIKSRLANPDNNSWGLEINGGTFNDAVVQLLVQRGYHYGDDGKLVSSEAAGTRTSEWLEENGGFISGGTFADMGDINDSTTNIQGFLAEGYVLQRTGAGLYSVLDADSDEAKASATSISIEYKDVTVAGTEGEKTYEVIVKANDDEIINDLASTDITFAYTSEPVTGGNIDFTVAPATDFTMTRYENSNRYMFNYNGVDAFEGEGNAITVATIKVTGYGAYTIATDAVDTNIVNATTVKDNLVDSYTAAGATDDDMTTGGLVINTDTDTTDKLVGEVTDGNIAVPTRTLTINLDFPNAVVDNVKAYQDMKVEITGNIEGVNKTVTYNLGKDEVAMADGDYVVEEDRLVLNNAYTVTVSGAGYRTSRYTVTMTEDKVLKFWNNVMDEAQFVEIGKESSKVDVTFLAGDIVKDNNINIYDLSAVVSYFGTENVVTAASDYAKYDLNRDGVIDSKDVAYVLVSWDK